MRVIPNRSRLNTNPLLNCEDEICRNFFSCGLLAVRRKDKPKACWPVFKVCVLWSIFLSFRLATDRRFPPSAGLIINQAFLIFICRTTGSTRSSLPEPASPSPHARPPTAPPPAEILAVSQPAPRPAPPLTATAPTFRSAEDDSINTEFGDVDHAQFVLLVSAFVGVVGEQRGCQNEKPTVGGCRGFLQWRSDVQSTRNHRYRQHSLPVCTKCTETPYTGKSYLVGAGDDSWCLAHLDTHARLQGINQQ